MIVLFQHLALDKNPGTGYDTLLLQLIPGDLLSVYPHRQFHTLPGLLDSRAALSISYSNASLTLARLLATILSWQVVPFLGHELGGYRIVHD